jgi:hypothetical protein
LQEGAVGRDLSNRWQRRPLPPITNWKKLHFRLHWQNSVGSGAVSSTVNQLKHWLVLWSRRSGLNGRPAVYETAALPTELRRPSRKSPQLTRVFSQPQGIYRAMTDERQDSPCPTNWLTNQPSGCNGRYLDRATGCSLTKAPWPGPGRQRGSCSLSYCSWAILSTCPLV